MTAMSAIDDAQAVYVAAEDAYWGGFDDFGAAATPEARTAVLLRLAECQQRLGDTHDTAWPEDAAGRVDGFTQAQSHLLSAQVLRVLAGAEASPAEWPATAGPLFTRYAAASDPADRAEALDALRDAMEPVVGWDAADTFHALSLATPAPIVDPDTGETLTAGQLEAIALGILRGAVHGNVLPPEATQDVRRVLADTTNSPKGT